MAVWSGPQIPAQAWRVGQPVSPVPLRTIANRTGAIDVYGTGLPEGIVVDAASLTIYGTPEQAGDFTASIYVTDDNSQSVTTFTITVAPERPPISLPEGLPEIVFRLPQGTGTDSRPVSFQFPAPAGGSGSFTTSLEYRPVNEWTGATVHNSSLPEGITYDQATRTLAGNILNSQANVGGSLAQVTLENAQAGFGAGNQTGYLAGTSTFRGPSFNYPALTGTVYQWRNIFTVRARPGQAFAGQTALRIGIEPDIEDPPNAIPNNPLILITDTDRNLLYVVPVALGSEQATDEANVNDLYFPFQGTFEFEEGEDYYIEIHTTPRSTWNYVVTDTITGQVARFPFSLLLVSYADTAPGQPSVLASSTSATTATITVAPSDPADISAIKVGYVQTGLQPPTPDVLRTYAEPAGLNNDVLHIIGLQPGTAYDFYVYSEGQNDELSAPEIISLTTLSARPAVLPLALTGLQAESGQNRLALSWDDIPPFQGITKLEHMIDNGPWRDIPHSSAATTGYVVPGLVDGTAKTIQVRAVNATGAGPAVSITATPGGTYTSPFRLSCQVRVLIDVDGQMVPLENRVLSAEGQSGRQPGTFDFIAGWASVVLVASDGLVRLVSPDGQPGIWSAADLRNRECHIVELYETGTGRLEAVTRFGGFVEEAPFQSVGQEQFIVLKLTDRMSRYARTLIHHTSILPRETAEDRCRRLIATAGVPIEEIEVKPNLTMVSQIDATPGRPYTGTLLARLSEIAIATGGRVYVEEDQQIAGTSTASVGRLVVEPARIQQQVVATLSDNPEQDIRNNPEWGPVGELANQPPAVLDASNLYNTVSLRVADGSEVIASDGESVVRWGGKLFPVSSVPVERAGAEALARYALRVWGQPRLRSDNLLTHIHFQAPEAGLALAKATLSDSLRVAWQPPGSSRIVRTGLIDRIKWELIPADRQYCQVVLDFALLAEEASQYWIVDRPGANALGSETWLAPAQPEDQDIISSFIFQSEGADAVVSAPRFNVLASQTWPRYTSVAERDRYEYQPSDGQPCMLIETATGGQKSYKLQAWSVWDNQWMPVAELSSADANPAVRHLIWDEGKWDDGRTWSA